MNFPALKNKIYFDTARSGLMYDELLNWRNSHENHFLKEGSQFRLNDEELLNETRLEINKFFNSPKSRTFLVQNFSIGLSKLLNSLKSNQSVMIIKDDYSSIIDQVRCSDLSYSYIENTFDLELQILNEIKKNFLMF
jgi:cysteine desulfurase/selenocysteine lyase